MALVLALVVTLATLGRVRVEWSGRPSATDGAADQGKPAAARTLGEDGRS